MNFHSVLIFLATLLNNMAHHRPESALIDFRIFPGVSTDDSMDDILQKFRDLIIEYVTQDLP
jgi:hypothetical protein